MKPAVLFLVILAAALLANLIALKIAADQASKQLADATSGNPLLKLLK